jgi:hypothetical protein
VNYNSKEAQNFCHFFAKYCHRIVNYEDYETELVGSISSELSNHVLNKLSLETSACPLYYHYLDSDGLQAKEFPFRHVD